MNRWFVAIDGNEIGKIIEKYILCEDLKRLSKFSRCMNECITTIDLFIKKNDGKVIMSGGDNILACVSEQNINFIKEHIKKYNDEFEFKFAMGAGTSLVEAYLALKYAKVNQLFSVCFEDGEFYEF